MQTLEVTGNTVQGKYMSSLFNYVYISSYLFLTLQLVTSFQCKDFNLVSANKVINQPKNRSTEMLPVESSRVHLTPKPGEDGSDYINATWIQGFHSLREFIITQHPLQNTVNDFWQMVWDHNAQTIVMLSYVDNQVRICLSHYTTVLQHFNYVHKHSPHTNCTNTKQIIIYIVCMHRNSKHSGLPRQTALTRRITK